MNGKMTAGLLTVLIGLGLLLYDLSHHLSLAAPAIVLGVGVGIFYKGRAGR